HPWQADLVGGQRVKHEGVVRIWTVGNGNGLHALFHCGKRWGGGPSTSGDEGRTQCSGDSKLSRRSIGWQIGRTGGARDARATAVPRMQKSRRRRSTRTSRRSST